MELREWQYINKPLGSAANNSSSSGAGNKSFKKRFDKLIQYYGQHLPAEVDYITVNLLTPGSLNFTEHYSNGDKVQYDIFIDDFATEDWGIKIKVNGQLTDKYFSKGWAKLLNTLGAYIELPQMGDPEYKNLLTEWVAMKNTSNTSSQPASSSKTSKTNKEKFTELLAYMQKHKDSSVIFTSVNGPNDTGFEYEEQKAFADGNEYNLSVEVERKFGDLFFIHIDMDGNRLATKSASGWEDFLLKLKAYFHVPKTGSTEYVSLTESASTSIETIPEKLYHATYWQFLKSIQQKGLGNTKRKMWSDSVRGVVYLADDPWVAESYAETAEWPEDKEDPDAYYDNIIILEIDVTKLDVSKIKVDSNVLLDEEEENATWEYHGIIPWDAIKIFNSSSMADDFKLYENLWD